MNPIADSADPPAMADRIARFDWTATPLGARDGWPRSLRSAVDLMLALPQPACIGWGSTRVTLYNDAYIPLLRGAHPAALGRPLDTIAADHPAHGAALADPDGAARRCVDVHLPCAANVCDPAGGDRWFTFASAPLRDDAGALAGVFVTGQESTARVRAEQALQERDALVGTLVGTPAQAMWETGPDGLVHVDSPSWRAYTGQSVDEWMGWGWLDAVHPDDREHARREWARGVATGSPVDAEFRLRRAEGGWRWTNVRALPLLHAAGGVRKWIGINIDIDARRRAADALRESQARLARELDAATLLQSLSSGLLAGDGGAALHARVVEAAAALVGSRGASLQRFDAVGGRLELLATHGFDDAANAFWRTVDVRNASTCGEALASGRRRLAADVEVSATLAGSADLDHYRRLGFRAVQSTPLVARDGRPLGMLSTHWPEPHEPGEDAMRRFDVLARMAADLLERDDAAARLARSEHLLQAALEASDVGTWVWYADRDESVCDLRTCELFGYPPGTPIRLAQALAERLHPEDAPGYREAIGAALDPAGDGRLRHEIRILRPDGGLRWLEIRGRAHFAPDGRARRIAGTTTDVTLRKREEADLAFLAGFERRLALGTDPDSIARGAAEAIASHFSATHSLLVDIDPDAELARIHWDHAAPGRPDLRGDYRLAEFHTPGELARLHAGEPVSLADVRRDCEPARAAGFERHGIRALATLPCIRDGRWVFALSVQHDRPHAWADGELALLRQLVDRLWLRLERARAERDLRDSRGRLEAIFANAAVGLAEIDASGRFVRANDELCRILGRAREAVLGRPVLAATHPDDVARSLDAIARARDTGATVRLEKRYRRPDGRVVWAESSVTPFRTHDGLPGNLLAVTVDLTDRKAAEAAREASEQLLRRFSDASADVLWIRDADTLRWEYLSPAYAQVYGEPLDAALADDGVNHWADRVLEADRARAIACLDRVRAGEQVTFEYRIRRADDGAVRWIRDTDFPIRGADGRVYRIGGIGHDITDLKHAQAELALSEERMRSLIQGIPQLVWRAAPGGACTWVSDQWLAYSGQVPRQALGRGWVEVVHPDDTARTLAAVEAARTSGRIDAEIRLRRADGAYVWHHVRSAPRTQADGTIVEWLGTCTDVQQLKELQEQQQVLVAELQHRTRNLIGIVRSIAERTAARSGDLADFRARFDDRMAALARVQGLLSQRDAGQRVTFDQLLQAELGGIGVAERVGIDGAVRLNGPAGIGLRSSTVQTFALGLHELATNALKYGALAQPGGRLEIDWHLEDAPKDGPLLHVAWAEYGVRMPPGSSADADHRGYGRELIERALPYQLRAQTRYELRPGGVHCTIRVPLGRP